MVAILAMDTSTGPCSVAIWSGGGVAAYLEQLCPESQSACLMPMVERALKESGLSYNDLTAVACTVGPGSFTGIRVGLAAARGIALAAGINGLGFTTLEVLAFAARRHTQAPVLALLNAGKGEYYYQPFDLNPEFKPKAEARLGIPEISTTTATAGNAIISGCAALPVSFPRADALAELAARHEKTAREPKPFYLRSPDAKPMADVR